MPTTKKGSIIIFSLITMSLIVVAALAMARVTLIERTGARTTSSSTNAFQTADGGVELFLQQIYRNLGALHSLDRMASEIAGASCNNGRITVGSSPTAFEIVAYETNFTNPEQLGLEVGGANGCDKQLADVAHFKVVGEYRDAVRALQLKIRDSLERGLAAHWNFEDNADAISAVEDFPGSAYAKDVSKNSHNLTLCPIDQDDHYAPPVSDESFDFCHQFADSAGAPFWMDHGSDVSRGSAWGGYNVSGIVDESTSAFNPGWNVPYGQALHFNGTSNYLTLNTSESSLTDNYVADEQLGMDDPSFDAIAVSLWFRRDNRNFNDSVKQILFAKYHTNNTNGHQLFIQGDQVRFSVNGSTRVAGQGTDGINNERWHHVVVTSDANSSLSSDEDIHLYIDGELVDTDGASLNNWRSGPLMIGGQYTNGGSAPNSFAPGSFREGFQGWIDDVRLYERGLTNNEITRLCDGARDNATAAQWRGCNYTRN